MIERISSTLPTMISAASGRMTVPVRPAEAVIGMFKHIQVIPDSRLESGIPLYKLRILDNLVERMMRRSDPSAVEAARQVNPLSIDSVIEKLIGRLGAAAGNPGFAQGLFPEKGLVVDLVA